MTETNRIKPLSPSVINRIAAGEIIIAPANALKEMLENSIDAKATSIEVLVKDGGVKLLQITDNGDGIAKEDLGLLCQRFTTSKLTTFDDLTNLDTYGFRGEALASISHIAHISVVTKNDSSPCAWKAQYSDGELIPFKGSSTSDPKPIAGKKGTQITVEDFFYNVPSRLKALKSSTDEFSKILDIIGRYAIHTEKVGMSCKKIGDAHSTLTTRPNLPIKERIRVVFGNSVANELIPIEIEDDLKEFGVVKVYGQITNPNFNNKKSIKPVIFINNRLVSNDALKRSLYSSINHFLPKGHKPFIYMSLHILPSNLDVNVHPTKREVRFLHEDEIIDSICVAVTKKLNDIDSSRSFLTQSLLPPPSKRVMDENIVKSSNVPVLNYKKPRLDYKLVRTDSSQSKITSYLPKTQTFPASSEYRASQIVESKQDSNESDDHDETVINQESINEPVLTQTAFDYRYIPKQRENVTLQSIAELRSDIQERSSRKLTEAFANMLFIGIVDEKRRLMTIQYDVKLLLVDYASLLNEFFYQIGVAEFSNFGVIHLDGNDIELDLREILKSVYEQDDLILEMSIDEVISTIVPMREMLKEYFSIEIVQSEDRFLMKSLPLLLKGYIPPLNKLPSFLYRLATKVDWNEEKNCLEGILRQISLLYIPQSFSTEDDNDNDSDDTKKQISIEIRQQLSETFEDILIPALKKRFLGTKDLEKDVIEIANLPGLYRVFERC